MNPHTDGGDAFGWPEVRQTVPGPGLAQTLDSRSMASLDDAELVDALDAHRRLTNVHQAQQLALIGELDARRSPRSRRRSGRASATPSTCSGSRGCCAIGSIAPLTCLRWDRSVARRPSRWPTASRS